MANFLTEACHEVPILAISDNQSFGKQKPSERYRNQDPKRWGPIAAQTATSDVATGAMACPPFGMHNEALVGGVACGIRSKSLQELLGHVGGPVLGVDAEPEGEVGAEDHC